MVEELYRVTREIDKNSEYGLERYEIVGNAYAETPEDAVASVLEQFSVESESDLAQLIEDDQQPIKTRFVAEEVPDQYEVVTYWDTATQELMIQEGIRRPDDHSANE